MKKNRSRICGKNISTLPTPASTPSVSKSRKSPSAIQVLIQSAIELKPASIHSIGTAATLKIMANNAVISPPRITQPRTGCSSTPSILSVAVGSLLRGCSIAFRVNSPIRLYWLATRFSSQPVQSRSMSDRAASMPGAAAASLSRLQIKLTVPARALPSGFVSPASSNSCALAKASCSDAGYSPRLAKGSSAWLIATRRRSMPWRVLACIGITGTPSCSCKLAAEIFIPRAPAMSIMFSTTIAGMPKSSTCIVR